MREGAVLLVDWGAGMDVMGFSCGGAMRKGGWRVVGLRATAGAWGAARPHFGIGGVGGTNKGRCAGG